MYFPVFTITMEPLLVLYYSTPFMGYGVIFFKKFIGDGDFYGLLCMRYEVDWLSYLVTQRRASYACICA